MHKIIYQPFQKSLRLFNLGRLITSAFSNQKQSSNYPYKFGGLKNVSFKKSSQNEQNIQNLFGYSTLDEFKQTYKFTLQALAQKNIQALTNVCEPRLVNNLSLQNVKVANSGSSIECYFGELFLIYGAKFIRQRNFQFHPLFNSLFKHRGMKFFSGKFKKDSLRKDSNVSFIIGFQVLFKSKIKLIPQTLISSNSQEIHSIQFQSQGNVNIQKIFDLMQQKIRNFGDPSIKLVDQLVKILFRQEQWNIGDIDRTLNGNLKSADSNISVRMNDQ